MKNYGFIILLLTGLLLGGTAYGQNNDLPVKFINGNFITGNNISKKTFLHTDLQPALFESAYFSLIQFAELPTEAMREQLKAAGIQLGEYLPGNAYTASIAAGFDFKRAADFKIVSVNVIPAMYKIAPSVMGYKKGADKNDGNLMAVNFNTAVSKQKAEAAITAAGAVIAVTKFSTSNTIFINPAADNIINNIALLPFVNYISLQQMNATAINNNNIATHGFSSIQLLAGRNLRGKNMTVGVGDDANISTHMDFTGRLINRVFDIPRVHGSHTSGTVAGGGIVNPLYQGMAPRATIISQSFNDIITNTPVYVADNNLIATNNSYFTGNIGCTGNSAYDVYSNYADVQLKNYAEVLHVFAAGNDGLLTCSGFPASFATIKSGWQTAKNVLTVGNLAASTFTINSNSSRGPVADGRLKPEIVANGTNTTSCFTNNGYGASSGTSMSAPVVTGATVLLNERYRQLHSANPKAALLKALLCNTAEDLGNAGPDFTYGFGMLNIRKAVEALEANNYQISSTTNASYPITVPAGVRRLKVMLYWADAAASLPAATTLVNDLDLTVSDNPVTTTYLPLVLDPSAANVTAVATEGTDHRNNIEQVVINNPAAGNYLMNVSAFALPAGAQEYVLTYQMDMNGITVEYPFGGETLVPGQTENIRWTAYGDEANTFTVSYSTDNGATWTDINTNVAATARSLSWVVPATISNTYLVRVSRNGGTGYTDQSDFNFVVLGQPVVTATVPCEGYVNLSWAGIGSASSYDILQQKGDSMEVIANTTSTSFLVQGLNSATKYWFGVRAKNGSEFGRRSVSVSATPSSGVCTLSDFDNNFKAAAIVAPVTGRQFTSTALSATASVQFTIKNLDDAPSSGNYDVSYQVNGGAVVTETIGTVIASLGSYTHTFTATYDFSVPNTYVIKAWVKRTGDTQDLDDTTSITIKQLANAPITVPLTDGFETTTAAEYSSDIMGLDGDDRADFKTNTARGRARTFVNTGFALNGNRAVTLDQSSNGALSADSLLMTYNAAAFNSGQQLRISFNYKNQGQDNNAANKVWIRGSDNKPWIYAYDLVSNQASLGNWKFGVININDVLDTVLPAQAITSSFQIKFGQEGLTSANSPYPVIDQDDGYTFDDISFTEALNDISLLSVTTPVAGGCNAVGIQQVAVTIKNYSSTTFSSVPVSFRVNGGAVVTETVPSIPANSTQAYTFTATVNLTANTNYSFDFWVTEPTDNFRGNDSVINYSFHSSPTVVVTAVTPYLQDFETDEGNWYTAGVNSSWQWGTPAKTVINKAPNGTKAWVTSLTGIYNDNELSYLYSPCFDLSALTQPVLSFSHIFQIESGFDYTWVEYSADGGITWNRLGTSSAGTNWYDIASPPKWGASKTKWHVASTDIPVNGTSVRFRIAMASDGGLDMEGVGIDDIHIFEKTNIYTGADITSGITQTVNGTGWTHFVSGGKRIASINPMGNNLGATNVFVYFNPAVPVRYSGNNQYYLDRNIVVQPTNAIGSGNAIVRFYFTDAEAKALMNATGCGICTTIGDPYMSGVTQFSGLAYANEDGILNNNIGGFFQFKLPAVVFIIPYDEGYYAEFPVNSFSEFWINNGGATASQPLPVSLLSFEAVKQNGKVLLEWLTENEVNTASYTVERSTDGVTYDAIGSVQAANSGRYNFTDAAPLAGINYYRLKSIDRNGVFRYSAVRKINFTAEGNDIMVYPNPVTGGLVTVTASVNCQSAQLFDAAGKRIRSYQLKGKTNTLPLAALAKGVYQLQIVTETGVQTEKIIIE